MKKTEKKKSAQSALSVEQDIVGLITALVQRLTALEAKVDTVLSRIPEKAADAHRQPQVAGAPVQRPKEARPVYQVICADCGKHCEVPFKPSPGRAVYCRECFARRKSNNNLAPRPEVKPAAAAPALQPAPEKPVAKASASPAAKKKPAPAKKPKKKAAKK